MQEHQQKIIQDIVDEVRLWSSNKDARCTIKSISYLLTKNKIIHKCVIGSAYLHGMVIPIHYWIELQSDYIIDIKFREWIKTPESPNGLIYAPASPVSYKKYKDFVEVISKLDYATITQKDARLN